MSKETKLTQPAIKKAHWLIADYDGCLGEYANALHKLTDTSLNKDQKAAFNSIAKRHKNFSTWLDKIQKETTPPYEKKYLSSGSNRIDTLQDENNAKTLKTGVLRTTFPELAKEIKYQYCDVLFPVVGEAKQNEQNREILREIVKIEGLITHKPFYQKLSSENDDQYNRRINNLPYKILILKRSIAEMQRKIQSQEITEVSVDFLDDLKDLLVTLQAVMEDSELSKEIFGDLTGIKINFWHYVFGNPLEYTKAPELIPKQNEKQAVRTIRTIGDIKSKVTVVPEVTESKKSDADSQKKQQDLINTIKAITAIPTTPPLDHSSIIGDIMGECTVNTPLDETSIIQQHTVGGDLGIAKIPPELHTLFAQLRKMTASEFQALCVECPKLPNLCKQYPQLASLLPKSEEPPKPIPSSSNPGFFARRPIVTFGLIDTVVSGVAVGVVTAASYTAAGNSSYLTANIGGLAAWQIPLLVGAAAFGIFLFYNIGKACRQETQSSTVDPVDIVTNTNTKIDTKIWNGLNRL